MREEPRPPEATRSCSGHRCRRPASDLHLLETLPDLGRSEPAALDATAIRVRTVLAAARRAERSKTDLRPYVVAALHALDVGDTEQAAMRYRAIVDQLTGDVPGMAVQTDLARVANKITFATTPSRGSSPKHQITNGAVASVVPLIAEVVQAIGPEKIRSLLSVLRELRISLEGDGA